MTMIEMVSVVRRFKGPGGRSVSAIDGVSLQISGGEFVTLVGPSGSGKSTLLFTIGAMLRPDTGRVLLDGKDLYAASASQRALVRRTAVGFVFQTFNLIPYLSCIENLALAAILSGTPRTEAFQRSREMLGRLGLSERLEHRPAELSIGERQRVAVGRAAIHRPQVLLADEPTGNLDPSSAERVMQLLHELHREGQTIVMVTHDPKLAETGQRTIRLGEGRVLLDRATVPEELVA
jgi:putative ABC transport system ATP-binding protein